MSYIPSLTAFGSRSVDHTKKNQVQSIPEVAETSHQKVLETLEKMRAALCEAEDNQGNLSAWSRLLE